MCSPVPCSAHAQCVGCKVSSGGEEQQQEAAWTWLCEAAAHAAIAHAATLFCPVCLNLLSPLLLLCLLALPTHCAFAEQGAGMQMHGSCRLVAGRWQREERGELHQSEVGQGSLCLGPNPSGPNLPKPSLPWVTATGAEHEQSETQSPQHS